MKKQWIAVVPIIGLFVFILTWLATNKLMMPLDLHEPLRLILSGMGSVFVVIGGCALIMDRYL